MAFLLCLCPLLLISQQEQMLPDTSEVEEIDEYKDTWTTPVITDEMTIDEEQNKSWRMGDYKYSSKPKHSWEFGLHFGHFVLDGDVDRIVPGGWGVGLHLRRALNYVVSLRGSAFYGMTRGLEKQPYLHRNVINKNGIGGGLVENVFDAYDPDQGGPGAWFPAYQTRYISFDISAIINVGNILFHQERNKWNLYVGFGIGVDTHEARLDLLNQENQPYANLINDVGWTREKFNTTAGRGDIAEKLETIYDGTYETEGFQKAGIFRLGDDLNVHFVFIPMAGVSRKINKRINIGIEHQVFLSDNDYLDGIKFRTAADQTNNLDIGHYTNIRIGLNIGNFKKVTEPLYWLNPLDQAFNDLAVAKNQTQLDLVDEDNDGVIDLIDQELDTPEDCPVDTRGILLDSDGDGLADCEDREPYSRPGCQIDEFGVAQCDDPWGTNEDEVNQLIDSRLEEFKSTYASTSPSSVSNYTGPTTTKSGTTPDGSTYVLTMPTDDNGNILATDRAVKTVTKDDGSTYDVMLPVDSNGNFIAGENGIRTGTTPDGSSYVLTSPVDSRGNFVATDKAKKVVTSPDGSQYVMTLPVDSNGDFRATTRATKTVVNPDGSGYVLSVPVDENGNFVATDSATKTVVNPDGSGYILNLPVDENGKYITTDSATKTVRKADGTSTKTTVSVDDNGNIITSGPESVIASGVISPNVQTDMASAKDAIQNSSTSSMTTKSVNDDRSPDVVSHTTHTVVTSGCGDWFLPMIHYDLNKSKIKPEYFSHLHNVAQVMKKCPEVCVVAQGHTDTRSSNEYNKVLSYMRAKAAVDYLTTTYEIDRSRIKLMYGGEENPMVLSPSTEAHHFMNRRVEFRTCDVNDFDMVAPKGANKTMKSGASKPEFYKGNKTSGY
ncbi:MAG: OmpA family protein [Bacteroidia bacterium]|nr:OmpA family protein [Bacteroidia bacterium]